MNECKQCKQEFKAKRSTAKYCSPGCKQDAYRNKSATVTPLTVTDVTVTQPEPVTVTEIPLTRTEHSHKLQHYQDNPNMYVPRQEPTRMNWGPYMTAHELEQAKFKCNRVALPGDHDYRQAVSA